MTDPIQLEIERHFGEDRRADVAAALEVYEGREPERVRLAILRLAHGDLEQVLYYLDQARMDYRDVLYWAEYPQPAADPVDCTETRRRIDMLWSRLHALLHELARPTAPGVRPEDTLARLEDVDDGIRDTCVDLARLGFAMRADQRRALEALEARITAVLARGVDPPIEWSAIREGAEGLLEALS